MGKWTLRLNDGSRAVRRVALYDPEAQEVNHHASDALCNSFGCGFLVEEHQRWGKPEEGEVPEFTIEVAFKTKDHVGNPVTPGWRYILKWRENGEQRQARQYGYSSKEAALTFAKEAANDIAKALTPVHVETYTPEM